MKTILGIEIPADLSTLSPEALKVLRDALFAAAKAHTDGSAGVTLTPDVLAEIREAREVRTSLKTIETDRAAETAALEADLAAEVAALEAEDGDDDDDEDEDEDAEDGDDEAESDAPAADEAVTASAPAFIPQIQVGDLNRPTGVQVHVPDAVIEAPRTSFAALAGQGSFRFAGGINNHGAGEAVGSMSDLGTALLDHNEVIRHGGAAKIVVASIKADFGDFVLDASASNDGLGMERNLQVLGGRDFRTGQAQQAITAAMCAPVTPYYGLGGMSSTERPVRGSMATYGVPRGGVSIYPTPRLSDIDDGIGIWTRADDANGAAVKAACATIACSTPIQYDLYGVYRCLRVKNMLQLTYPELVDAYLNRLHALQARLAEETLLDAMVGSANTKSVTVAGTELDASIDLWTTILNAIAVYREEERYTTEVLEMRAHRWMLSALRIGLIRQRRTSGRLSDRIPTEAEVNAVLRDLGVEPTWTLDYATSWESIAPQVDGAPLSALPTQADFHLTPRGNFRAMDEGFLNIGVTNNIAPRDGDDISKNEFRIFIENYEGIIDFGAISYHVTISDFLPNGAQTGDIEPLTNAEANSN